MERAGNGASGKRCDIDGVTRTGELAGVSESSRDIDGQTREGERAGENESIGRARLGGLRRFRRRCIGHPALVSATTSRTPPIRRFRWQPLREFQRPGHNRDRRPEEDLPGNRGNSSVLE